MFEYKEDEERQRLIESICAKCFFTESPSVEMAVPEVSQMDKETLHDKFRRLYNQKDWLNMTEEELREALKGLLKEE